MSKLGVRSGNVCRRICAAGFLLISLAGRLTYAVVVEPEAASPSPAGPSAAASGLSGWIVQLYHYDLFLYGLAVVGVMALMGVTIGYAMDYVVSRIGIDLGKLDHRE